MTLQTMYPVFIPTGDSTPMTPYQVKVLIGAWIVLNIIWALSLLYSLIRYFIERRQATGYMKDNVYFRDSGTTDIPDLIMMVLWGIILLILAGAYIADKFL